MTTEKNDRAFSIYYTDMGLTSVSGEVELKIMELLKSENLTLANISKTMNLPTSSILFNIVKLEERRLIGSYRDTNDHRKIYYTLISYEFFKSMEPYSDSEEYAISVLTRMVSDKTYAYRGLLEILVAKCARLGLDIGCALERGGLLLGRTIKNDFIPEDIIHLRRFLEKYFIEADIPHILSESENPTMIHVSVTNKHLNNGGMDLTHRCIIGLVCSSMKQVTGKTYKMTSVTADSNSKSVLFIIKPVQELKTVPNSLLLPNGMINVQEEDDPEKFCIIPDKNGYPRLVNNSLQIDILKSLERFPQTLKTLNIELPGPQSTLFSNLTKLEKAEIIYIDRNSVGSNQYKTYGSILLQRYNSNTNHTEALVRIFEKAIHDPKYYYYAILRYIMIVFDVAGIDTSKIHRDIGMELADIIIQHNDKKTVDQMIEDISKKFLPNGSTIEIKSFIPLTIIIHTPLFTDIGGIAIMNFYAGMISEFIFTKTGRMYDVTSVNQYFDDNVCAVKFSLEPKISKH